MCAGKKSEHNTKLAALLLGESNFTVKDWKSLIFSNSLGQHVLQIELNAPSKCSWGSKYNKMSALSIINLYLSIMALC